MKLLLAIILCLSSAFASGKIESNRYKIKFKFDDTPKVTRSAYGTDYEITKDSVYFTTEENSAEVLPKGNVISLKYQDGTLAIPGAIVTGVVVFIGSRFSTNESHGGAFNDLEATLVGGGLGLIVGYLVKRYDPIDLKAPTKEISYNFYPNMNLLTGSCKLNLQIKF